jgi:hypothetical protein
MLNQCGPSLMTSSWIQPSGKVKIPGYTWKIVVCVPTGTGSALSRITTATRCICVKMPNIAGIRSVSWSNYIVKPTQIETDTGYHFFTALPTTIADALRGGSGGGGGTGSHVVISEVYGAGGNSGATYNADFIELYNPTSASVSLSGWAVQYASSTGSSWSVTALSGSIAAGKHYLIAESSGTTGASLPTPQVTGSISMAATAGKVCLTSSTTALSGTNPSGGTVVDKVGYGSGTNGYEGSGPAPAPSATTSDQRNSTGADTDNNAADFTAISPTPSNN